MVDVKKRIKTAFEEGLARRDESKRFREKLRKVGLEARRKAILEQFKVEQARLGKKKARQLAQGKLQTLIEEVGKAKRSFEGANQRVRQSQTTTTTTRTRAKPKRRKKATKRRTTRRQEPRQPREDSFNVFDTGFGM